MVIVIIRADCNIFQFSSPFGQLVALHFPTPPDRVASAHATGADVERATF